MSPLGAGDEERLRLLKEASSQGSITATLSMLRTWWRSRANPLLDDKNMNQSVSPLDKKKVATPLSSDVRKGILVLGMHRSGTSALTNVLHLLGCQLPKNLIGPGLGNELGHWESEPIVAFNDDVLASAGSSWNDWRPFNSGWYQSPLYRNFVARGRNLLREEFEASSLFVLKDPRICRIANLWLEIFAAEGVETAVVLPVRNPIEVGNSLNDRDLMDVGYGHLLWLRHFLDAEIASRGLSRIFCTYDQLLNDWPMLIDRMKAALGICWPRVSAAAGVEISTFLKKDHRHYVSSPSLAGHQISHWISKGYDIADRWSNSGETVSDMRILDSIRSEFDSASAAFAHLLLPGTRSGVAGKGSRRRAELEQLLGDAEARAGAAEAELEGIRQELGVTKAREALLADELRQKSDALNDFDELVTKIATAEIEITRLSDVERSLGERLEHSEVLLGEKTAQLDADAARFKELAAERNAFAHRLADVESTLRQREEEIAQAWSELEAVRLAKTDMQSEFDQLAKDAERQSRLREKIRLRSPSSGLTRKLHKSQT
ncbi:MAG: hypothetical protein ABI395_00145 [Sphingobium sp.]